MSTSWIDKGGMREYISVTNHPPLTYPFIRLLIEKLIKQVKFIMNVHNWTTLTEVEQRGR